MKLLIVGAGPAGTEAALKAARLGWDVILFAKDQLGGVCLNEGCIPTKSLLEDAFHLNKAQQFSPLFNPLSASNMIVEHKSKVVTGLRTSLEQELKNAGVKVLNKKASFLDDATLADDDGVRYTSDFIVIATGAQPSMPPLPYPDSDEFLNSRSLLDAVYESPQRFCVIGGGVIGLELSSYLRMMGHEVQVIEAAPRILLNAPKELAMGIERDLKSNGIKIQVNAKIASISHIDNTYLVDTGNGPQVYDRILVATGRKPNIVDLALENTHLEVERGAIRVDSHFKTNLDTVYAIGDVNGSIQLAHNASDQGEQLIDWLAHGIEPISKIIPFGLYTPLQAAWVGLSEDEAKANGIEVKVKKVLITALAKQKIKVDTRGFIKFILDPADHLLGAEILSADATELIGTCVLLIDAQLDLKQISHSILPHPTLSEAFKFILKQIA